MCVVVRGMSLGHQSLDVFSKDVYAALVFATLGDYEVGINILTKYIEGLMP